MKPIIIRPGKLKEKSHRATKVTDILKTKKFNIAKVRIMKTNNEVKFGYDKKSDVAYYVLQGEGGFVINEKEYRLKKGDCIFCPKGTKYKSLKGLTLLAIASPPSDRKNRRYIKVNEPKN
jgi:mannose-6-phosphate isomerase-like protein (cupin superfamily)